MRPVPDFPAYTVDESGTVFTHHGKTPQALGGGYRNPKGYAIITLCGPHGQQRFYTHQVVCMTYHGPRPSPNHCVRHKNGNTSDNRPANLEWGTYAENEEDKRRHGTWLKRITNGKLTPEDLVEIRRLRALDWTQKEIGLMVGVTRETISRVLSGKIWNHGP